MKKTLALLISCVLLMTVMLCGCTGSKDEKLTPTALENYDYYVLKEKNCAAIKKYIGEEKDVVIPDEIEGYPVTSLDFDSFAYADIRSVVIPETVTVIWEHAFYNNKKIEKVVIKSTDLEIQREAFKHCIALKELELSDGVKALGAGAFEYCTNLKKVHIPSTIEKWGQGAFNSCHIEELTFEDGIERIGSYACFWSTTLETVTIPASVKEIGEGSFGGALKSAYFEGDAPEKIGKHPFNENVVLYHKKRAKGWDTTPLKNDYKLVEYK